MLTAAQARKIFLSFPHAEAPGKMAAEAGP